MGIGVGDVETAAVGHGRAGDALVAAAPILVDVIEPDGPPGSLVISPDGQLPWQDELEVGGIALDGSAAAVGSIDALLAAGPQITAEIERSTESQRPARREDGVPLKTDLPLELRNAVTARTDDGIEIAVADYGGGHGDVGTVDSAPIILGGDADGKILERLPADPQLDLGEVALALVSILHGPDIAPHGVVGPILAVILGSVTDGTVRREAETQPDLLGDGNLERDVVEIERIVRGLLGSIVDGLRIVIILPLDTETEEERLPGSGAESGGIEHVGHAGIAHGDPHAAHRTHRKRPGRRKLADTVHGIGRKGVDTAGLGRGTRRETRQHRRAEQATEGLLHLH